MCIKIKNDDLLPFALSFNHNLLKFEHTDSFLKFLGFVKNESKKQWICFKHLRLNQSLIDFGIVTLFNQQQQFQFDDASNDHSLCHSKMKKIKMCNVDFVVI